MRPIWRRPTCYEIRRSGAHLAMRSILLWSAIVLAAAAPADVRHVPYTTIKSLTFYPDLQATEHRDGIRSVDSVRCTGEEQACALMRDVQYIRCTADWNDRLPWSCTVTPSHLELPRGQYWVSLQQDPVGSHMVWRDSAVLETKGVALCGWSSEECVAALLCTAVCLIILPRVVWISAPQQAPVDPGPFGQTAQIPQASLVAQIPQPAPVLQVPQPAKPAPLTPIERTHPPGAPGGAVAAPPDSPRVGATSPHRPPPRETMDDTCDRGESANVEPGSCAGADCRDAARSRGPGRRPKSRPVPSANECHCNVESCCRDDKCMVDCIDLCVRSLCRAGCDGCLNALCDVGCRCCGACAAGCCRGGGGGGGVKFR